MNDFIEGDWRMLVDEEPLGPGNRICTLRDGAVLDANGDAAGAYEAIDEGGYRITLGEMVCSVRPFGTGAINALSGSVDYGDWSDPVTFSRVRYDFRPQFGIKRE